MNTTTLKNHQKNHDKNDEKLMKNDEKPVELQKMTKQLNFNVNPRLFIIIFLLLSVQQSEPVIMTISIRIIWILQHSK